jgi:hypothetical protein
VAHSEFGDLTRFIIYGEPGAIDESHIGTRFWESPPPDTTTKEADLPPNPVNPGIWLINLAVLTAATRLRVDPWNETQGYQQCIVLPHWHPSFALYFPSFF